MDQQLAELKAACERYKSQPVASGAVGALDWTALLVILPAVLSLFVKDAALRDVIMRVIDLLKGVFAKESA